MFYGHDACVMMLPQHVTCVSKFQECKGSLRAKVHEGSKMRLDIIWHSLLVLGNIDR